MTAVFRNSGVYQQPIKVWKETIRNASPSGRTDVLELKLSDAVDQAMEEMVIKVNRDAWRGTPSDQTANVMTSIHGAIHAMNTTNTYGALDRSTTTFTDPQNGSTVNYWAGNRVTGSKTASIHLLDDALYTQSLMAKNPSPPDLALCGLEVFYTIKKEALAKGAQMVTTDIPELARTGVRFEAIKYGRTTYIADPTLTGDWSAQDAAITDATKVVAFFNTDDWVFSAHPDENFRVTRFNDPEGEHGKDDALTAQFQFKGRMYCRRPEGSILYTNVSA